MAFMMMMGGGAGDRRRRRKRQGMMMGMGFNLNCVVGEEGADFNITTEGVPTSLEVPGLSEC